MTNIKEDYHKIVKVIESSTRPRHMLVCDKLISLFRKKYNSRTGADQRVRELSELLLRKERNID